MEDILPLLQGDSDKVHYHMVSYFVSTVPHIGDATTNTMREEMKQAYVERMTETDPSIQWYRANAGDDENMKEYEQRHIALLVDRIARTFDTKLDVAIAQMEEAGISEDMFMAFDIVVKTVIIELTSTVDDLEDHIGEWEYWADSMYDNISSELDSGRPYR